MQRAQQSTPPVNSLGLWSYDDLGDEAIGRTSTIFAEGGPETPGKSWRKNSSRRATRKCQSDRLHATMMRNE